MSNPDIKLTHFETRIMRHIDGHGKEWFAIHDVYFNDTEVVGYTADALSPKEATIDLLAASLQNYLESFTEPDQLIQMGDLNYGYEKEDIEHWLEQIELPHIDYLEDDIDV